MVSILPANRSPWDVISQQIGQGLQQTLPGAIQQGYQRGQGLGALDRAQAEIEQAGGDPFKIALAFARAGAQNEPLARSLGPLYETAMNRAAAINAQKAPLAGEGVPRDRTDIPQVSARAPAPTFMGQPEQGNKFFPTNIGPQDAAGNRPQAATTGQKVPLSTPQEQIQQAKQLSRDRTAAGIPTTPKQALEEVREAEQAKKLHNAEVDKELAQRVKSQQEYGQRAAKELKAKYPKATPEHEAIFQKIGEDISARGGSEAEINRAITKEADKFVNAIDNVKKDISAPRLYNRIHRLFNGTDKNFEEAAQDMRVKLKPILDLGLYDTARNLLSEQGYAPEERDAIINDLSPQSKAIIKTIPKHFEHRRPENIALQEQNIKDTILQVLQNNPNASLPLMRKGFEDRGYDWLMFKGALNELIQQNPNLLTDDQRAQIGILDTPPLNHLERYLEALHLIGR